MKLKNEEASTIFASLRTDESIVLTPRGNAKRWPERIPMNITDLMPYSLWIAHFAKAFENYSKRYNQEEHNNFSISKILLCTYIRDEKRIVVRFMMQCSCGGFVPTQLAVSNSGKQVRTDALEDGSGYKNFSFKDAVKSHGYDNELSAKPQRVMFSESQQPVREYWLYPPGLSPSRSLPWGWTVWEIIPGLSAKKYVPECATRSIALFAIANMKRYSSNTCMFDFSGGAVAEPADWDVFLRDLPEKALAAPTLERVQMIEKIQKDLQILDDIKMMMLEAL